ncbi:hypothetical protein PR202_gb15097 [Eleusine coracana subsp. coracana]|uniref:BED-type domain-containing protein n=1 Tax=Eleusine coracana subsp. coracana TaxID=191504 RepID=A0AAV5EW92_ELECO|nr:hypothetical protein PR202_gb15097 [Eleusine coracana subsp. coracana]
MQVRHDAVCNHCKAQLTARSSGGTGHLLRHHTSCLVKTERANRNQTLLRSNTDGTVCSWYYDPNVTHLELCRLIVIWIYLFDLVFLMHSNITLR